MDHKMTRITELESQLQEQMGLEVELRRQIYDLQDTNNQLKDYIAKQPSTLAGYRQGLEEIAQGRGKAAAKAREALEQAA